MFIEGLRTEEDYLTYWRRQYRDRVLIEINPFRDAPMQLVERAVAAKRSETRDARRGRGRPHNQIWCMFDRDEHPNFDRAIDKAQAPAERYDKAWRRAVKLDEKHEGDGSPPRTNPSSGVWRLIDVIRDA